MINSWRALVAFSLLCLGPKSHSFVSATINEVTTFAGGGYGSANGIGTTAQFQFPQGVGISSDGLYAFVADNNNHLIRRIVISTASTSTLAGAAGQSGSANGIGTNSRFNYPPGICVSPDGIYAFVSDNNNHLIRQIVISTANVTSLAGLAGTAGSSNGIGSNARFFGPYGVSISPDGLFLLVADSNNAMVRRIIISTRAVTLVSNQNVQGVIVSPDGLNAYIAGANVIRQIVISSASVTTIAGSGVSGTANGIGTDAQFYNPYGLGISPDGLFLLVADNYNELIRQVIISTRSVTTVAGVAGSSGSTNAVGTNAKFSQPTGVSISPDGTYAFVADSANNMIRRITLLDVPTFAPTAAPSTVLPSRSPSVLPSTVPSALPSTNPSLLPTITPSAVPSRSPSVLPTTSPSDSPTSVPTSMPSALPTISEGGKYSFAVVFGDHASQGLENGDALGLDYVLSYHQGLLSLSFWRLISTSLVSQTKSFQYLSL
jgi:DNA-binding beta-propeller fold protein YncE